MLSALQLHRKTIKFQKPDTTQGGICADGGYNAQALLSWLAQNNYLQTSKPHLTKTVRINNIPTRCVVLRLPQLENDDFEPLDYIPD